MAYHHFHHISVSFLGICGFYQRFEQKNYSTLVAPVTDLFNKEVEWILNAQQEQSFQKLKAALCQASTLTYLDVCRTIVVQMDASHVDNGATLSQEDAAGQLCLLNSASHKFHSAEKNYPTVNAPSTCVVRWMADLFLSNYDVCHLPSSAITAADALSPMYPVESLSLLEVHVSPGWTDAYRADPALLELCS